MTGRHSDSSCLNEIWRFYRATIRSADAENLLPERLQLHNWLVIELLLEVGTRRGELTLKGDSSKNAPEEEGRVFQKAALDSAHILHPITLLYLEFPLS